MRIEKLDYAKHNGIIKDFDCGNDVLNEYLKTEAYFDYDAVTHITVDKLDNCLGFFSLSCSGLYLNDSRVNHIFPAVELKCFAIDRKYQGKYNCENSIKSTYAELMLSKVIFDFIYDFTENLCGASRIILYSVPKAVNFYRRADFDFFENMFLYDESSYLDGCIPMIYNFE